MFRRHQLILIATALLLLSWPQLTVRADFLEVRVPGSNLTIVLEGRVQKGRTVRLSHKFGTLYFDNNDVTEVYEVPTNTTLFGRMAAKARADKDADALFEAAKWALKHALLHQFYQGIEQTLDIDPDHPAALRAKALKEKIDVPLPESDEEEERLKRILNRQNFNVERSNHFILLHDTNPAGEMLNIAGARRRPPRAKERLRLLEDVYETFLFMFIVEGVEIDIPRERLQVLLFKENQDYLDFSKSLNPALASAVGFWDPTRNVSVFYDNATDELYKAVQESMEKLQEQKEQAVRNRSRAAKTIVRNTNTLQVMFSAAQERSDIKVVTHEATHQLAGNTGLLPRHVRIPNWAHEGLATYFEAPAEATWSGVGAVNKDRLDKYRALAEDVDHSNIDFIVTDQIFMLAGSHNARLHAYGQAWALTHFLMENHFPEFVKYYALLAQMPPDITLNPDVLLEIFDRAFGEDRKTMTLEWRAYMRGLKTDFEIATEKEKEDEDE